MQAKESKLAVKITVKKVNRVMHWNILGDPRCEDPNPNKKYTCKICKGYLLSPPPQELQFNDDTNSASIEGTLAKGTCGDVFHEKCIQNSLNSGCVSCPTCNSPWTQKKLLSSGVTDGNMEELTIKKKTAKAKVSDSVLK